MREGSVSATLSGYEASASEGGRRTRAWQRLGAPLHARLNGWIERGLPLQQLLFLALLSVSAIPALVFAVWEDRTAMTREMDAARDKHLVIAKHLAQALTRYERDVTAVFRFVVSQGERAGKAPGMPDLLTSLDFRYLCIFDDRNATLHLWMAPQMSRASLPQPELKRLLREKALAAPGKPVMTNFMLSGGTPLLFLVQTVDDHSFAVAGIGAGYFSELRKAITFGEHGHAAIFDRAGHIIAHPSPEWEATLHDLSQAPPVAAAMRGGTGVTTFFSPAVKAQMITGYAAVPGVGWGVMVPQPLSEIAARAHSARDVAFAIGGAGLVLAALVSWWLARRLTAPIRAVAETAGKIAAGGGDERVPPFPARTPRELRDLAGSFNRMVDDLDRSAHNLAAAEAELRQAQKLEALGRLTGGIAHDFNNVLTIIGGNLELLEQRCPAVPGISRIIKTAASGVLRAQKLTQQLLAYARKQTLQLEPLDVNQVVGEIAELAKVIAGARIELLVTTAPVLRTALSDKNQLETALLNLVANARDAIADSGMVAISTGQTTLDGDEFEGQAGEVAPGDYVTLTVADTGAGMSPEVREKAIEPFFTTKGVGKGTGLGLSMVYGFMRQSGGFLTIDSEPGEGTRIRLYFRCAERVAAAEDATEVPARLVRLRGPASRNKMVLIVEDDPSVREFAASVLRESGYTVLEASQAEPALDVLMQENGIDVLLSDVVMPGEMTGKDLARMARAHRTELAVILTTGYSDQRMTDWPVEGTTFLAKPYRVSDLMRAVDAALESARHAQASS